MKAAQTSNSNNKAKEEYIKKAKDAIVETVAESILSQEKPVGVVDSNNKIVGALHASHVINVLFGSRSEETIPD